MQEAKAVVQDNVPKPEVGKTKETSTAVPGVAPRQEGLMEKRED